MQNIIATITTLLLYISKAAPENPNAAVKSDSKQADIYPDYHYQPVVNPPPLPDAPEDNLLEKDKPNKPFGGDRSDPWLYPGRNYYVYWVDTEEGNGWDTWDSWDPRHMQQTTTTQEIQ